MQQPEITSNLEIAIGFLLTSFKIKPVVTKVLNPRNVRKKHGKCEGSAHKKAKKGHALSYFVVCDKLNTTTHRHLFDYPTTTCPVSPVLLITTRC